LIITKNKYPWPAYIKAVLAEARGLFLKFRPAPSIIRKDNGRPHGGRKMHKKITISITMVFVLLGSIVVAIGEDSKMNCSSVPVVTPPANGSGSQGDVLIQGTAVSQFNRVGAWGWTVHIDKVIDGPGEMHDEIMSIFQTSADPSKYPPGFLDPNIRVGDRVEAYGDYSVGGTNILLTGNTSYYLKSISPTGTP
jgi:hypothetical protein